MLQLSDISFSYPGNRLLLDGCTLETRRGNIYALMGPNGAGKTTLFNIITGFLKVNAGTIQFGNERIDLLQPYIINRKGIGRTFQDLRLVTRLNVKDNIRLAIKNDLTDSWYGSIAGINRTETGEHEQKVASIIQDYHLAEVQDNLAGEISYGQQKLLTIACCVANDAELLLLDEPVAGINPVYRQQIAGVVKKLKATGKTIILIEHNTEFIDEVADVIFFMAGGKINSYKNLAAMRTNKEVIEAYM